MKKYRSYLISFLFLILGQIISGQEIVPINDSLPYPKNFNSINEQSKIVNLQVKSTVSDIAVNKQDSLALIEFYNNSDGKNWGEEYKNSWLTGNVNRWEGITIKDNRVTELNIYAKQGSIHSSIGKLSALTIIRLSGNFSGTIPNSIGKLSSLEELTIGYSSITGPIPESIGNLSNLKYLTLKFNDKLTGIIPESIGNLTNLGLLDLQHNKLTGEIPSSIGNLSNLTMLELENNNLTGEIPSTIGNLSLLLRFYLFNNNLSGKIPSSIGNLGLLERLYLFENNLSRELPESIGNLSSLTDLGISNNNLSGEIPKSIGNIKSLQYLYLHENNFSGEIPQSLGNLNSIVQLNLKSNKLTGTIPASIGNLKTLHMLSLRDNDLSGEIPQIIGNLTSMRSMFLSNNNFHGDVPSSIENLTYLYDLHLDDNDLSSITKIPANLKELYVSGNSFDFDDLEPLVRKGLYILGRNQDPLLLEKESINGKIKLTMNCGGTKNTYRWYYDKAITSNNDTNKTFTVPHDKDIQKFYCTAKNNLLKNIILVGIPPEEKDCWQAGQLTFCVHSGKWEKGGTNKIKTTNTLSINDFLFFDGTMTIDTTDLEIDANGEFYVKDIPLPGGSIGKYSLSQGKYNLKLMGKDGEITNFLNSKLESSPELFGVKLKLDNLQLVKDKDKFGLKIGCTMSVPGVKGSCEGNGDTDISLNGLEITTAGISLGGVEIKDLGLFFDGYCLKQLSINYDSKKDILTSGMQLALPFGEVGGGFKLEEGLIDSIAWNIEAAYAPFVLGSTTIGIKGFFGHISNITKPAIEVELGGIFSDIISDDLYRITASGKTVWPTYFEVKGTGQFLRPIINELPFQLLGKIALSYDIPNELFKINFDGNFGTTDEKTWLIKGVGNFKICSRYDPPKFAGGFDGTLTLPKLSSGFPYNWLNSMFIFPVKMKTINRFIWGKNKVVYGTSSFKSDDYGPYSLKYVIDLEKTWEDEDYISYEMNVEKTKSAIIKSGLLANTGTKIFTIPENTDFAVIEINSAVKIPVSTITNPAGTKYSDSSTDNNILYTESTEEKEGFWSVANPQKGDWEITLENPDETDTIITYFQLKENEFKFTTNQTDNLVTVSWDVAQTEDGQTVKIFLDDDNADFDGFPVSEGDAKSGSLSFTLDENTPDCSYYLYVQLIGEYSVVQSYADEVIDNPLASLAPPLNFTSYYNPETGECEFNWDTNETSNTIGYILTITDNQDNDSVYAIINGNKNSISLFIEDFETKSAEIKAYNGEWKIGCPSVLTKLSTGINKDYQIIEKPDNLRVYPNPTNGELTIRYYVSEPSECDIRIYNIQGKEIAQPLSEFQTTGFHEISFRYEQLPDGIYLIKYISNNQAVTIKSVLSR